MKTLGYMALLVLAIGCHPAHATNVTVCPDGTHYVPAANNPAWCPLSITPLSTVVTDTTVTINGTISAATGTTYGSVTLGACGTPLRHRQIRAGTPDEASASEAQNDTSVDLDFTGLVASTTYCGQVFNDTSGKISLINTATFTTNPSGGGGGGSGAAITGGDDFFAGTGGSDGNSGLTHALRWANPPANDATLGTSADMWFLSGTIYNLKQYTVTRAGTSGNWSENGCYYDDAGTVRKCVNGTHTKPEFRGGLTSGCLSAGTCLYKDSQFGAYNMSSRYDAYYEIDATGDYSTHENMIIRYAAGYGLNASGDNSMGSLHHVHITGIEIYDVGKTPLPLENGVRQFVVRRVVISDYNTCEQQIYQTSITNSDWCNEAGWDGGVAIVRSSGAEVLVEDTDISFGFGEGFNVTQSDHVIFRRVRASNTWSNTVYPGAGGDVIVEDSVFIGSDSDVGNLQGGFVDTWAFGKGINAGFEDYQIGLTGSVSPTGILYRNNLFVEVDTGYLCSIESGSVTAGKRCGIKFYGNTVIASTDVDLDLRLGSGTEHDFQDNVFWSEGLTASTNCQWTIGTVGRVVVKNHWYLDPLDSDCDGTGDTYGDPDVGTLTHAQFIANYGDGVWPTFPDVDPQVSSPVKGTGTQLVTDIIDAAAYGYAVTNIDFAGEGITQSNWEKALYYDATNAVRANPPSKGAVE